MSNSCEFLRCSDSSGIETDAMQKYCPAEDVYSGLNSSATEVLESETIVASGCKGLFSLSVQKVETSTLSINSGITEVIHVTVKFHPAMRFSSLTIETFGSGNAEDIFEIKHVKCYHKYSIISL